VAVELLLPRPVARHAGCLGTPPLDEERVPVGVVVKATLDVEPLLELSADLGVVDAGDEVVDSRSIPTTRADISLLLTTSSVIPMAGTSLLSRSGEIVHSPTHRA